MHLSIPLTKRILVTATASAAFFLSGCFQDSDSGEDAGALIEGRVTGGMALGKRASGGLEGASVTVVRLKADGAFEIVSQGAAMTDAQGRFAVASAVEAAHGLVVVARAEGRELRAVVSGEVKRGARAACRPLDLESTLEADVYAKTRSGGKVSFADIAAYVDSDLAARAAGDAGIAGFIAAQLEIEAETRASVLLGVGGSTRARLEKAEDARLKAQASLEAALHAAAQAEGGIAAEARARLEAARDEAGLQAVAGAGIALGEWAKAREASFQAMMRAQGSVVLDAEIRLAWLRSIAIGNAATLEAALEEDVEIMIGDASLVAEAGAALRASLETAATADAIDSAFRACRGAVASDLEASLTGVFGTTVGLPDSSRARANLEASLEAAATAEAVARSYETFYAEAEAEIEAALEAAGSLSPAVEPARAEAAARAALLVSLPGAP